jgi:hypothetical protein
MERNKTMRQITIAYVANLASNAAQSRTTKISIRDIGDPKLFDVKPIDKKIIEGSIDSSRKAFLCSVVFINSSAVEPALLS